MEKRKFTTIEERENLIQKFLASGKSQLAWCKENNVKTSTFGKWMRDYNSRQNEVKFIPLSPDSKAKASFHHSSQEILIEVGACRFHVPEHLGIQLLMQTIKAVNESHVPVQGL